MSCVTWYIVGKYYQTVYDQTIWTTPDKGLLKRKYIISYLKNPDLTYIYKQYIWRLLITCIGETIIADIFANG